jgi:hypothetical protein
MIAPVWMAFSVGMFLGVIVGILVLSSYVMAKQSDTAVIRNMSPASAEFREKYCLKMFCEEGHEWFGECIPSVCPSCYKPCIGARL